MKLGKQEATVFVTEDGKQVLSLAAISLPSDGNAFQVKIEESEDLGLWLRLNRQDASHFFLLRWEYILAIDLADIVIRAVGLQREKEVG